MEQTIKEQVKEQISQKNKIISESNKHTVSMIFQKVSLSGVLYFISFIMMFAYITTKEALNFDVGLPVISTVDMKLNSREDQDGRAQQIFDRFVSLQTPFEAQMFINDHVYLNENDLANTELSQKINNFVRGKNGKLIYDFEILEVHQVRGDTYFNESEKATFLTSSEYSFVIRQEELSGIGNNIIPDPHYYAYTVEFDTNMKIKDIRAASDNILVTKYRYLDFLDTITPQNIGSNVALNSAVSSLSLSYIKIEKVEFSDFRMNQSISGDPTGSFIVTINNESYNGYIKVAPDGLLSLYIS